MDKNSGSLKATVMVSFITAFCLLGDSMLYIVLPLYWRDFGLDALWQAGALLSVNRLIRLPFNPIALWLYARAGQKRCMTAAVFLACLTTALYSFTLGFWPLLLVRSLWGMSWSLLRLGAYFSILRFAGSSERGRHMGVYNGVFRLGSLFGMLGGALLSETAGPFAPGYIFAGCGLMAFPIAFKYIPGDTFKSKGQRMRDSIEIFRDSRLIRALIATSFLTALVYQGVFTSMLSYVTDQNQIRPDFLSDLGLGAASLAGLLQAIRWTWEPYLAPKIGRLSDEGRGRRQMLSNFCLAAACLFLLVSYKMYLWYWLFVVIAIQIAGTGITTLADAAAADVAAAGSKAPTVLSAHSFAIDLGSATGPLLGYLLNTMGGLHAPFLMAGGCLLTVSLLWRVFRTDVVK